MPIFVLSLWHKKVNFTFSKNFFINDIQIPTLGINNSFLDSICSLYTPVTRFWCPMYCLKDHGFKWPAITLHVWLTFVDARFSQHQNVHQLQATFSTQELTIVPLVVSNIVECIPWPGIFVQGSYWFHLHV